MKKCLALIDIEDGTSVKLLQRIYSLAKLDELNVVGCFSSYIKKPTKEQIKNANQRVVETIGHTSADLLFVFGSLPFKILAGKQKPIKSLRNRMLDFNGLPMVVTYSPMILFDKPEYASIIAADIKWGLNYNGDKKPVEYRVTEFDELNLINGIYAYDIETNGLFPYRIGSKIKCSSVSAVPTRSVGFAIPPALICNRDTILVGQNIKFDVLWTEKVFGNRLTARLWDTKVAGSLLNENLPDNSLKHFAAIYTDMGHYEDETKGYKEENKDRLLWYNMQDADASRRLYDVFEPKLRKQGQIPLFNFLMDVERTLIDIEHVGVLVDRRRLQELNIEVTNAQYGAEEAFQLACGRAINLNSSQQISKYLYEDLRLPVLGRTKSGNPSIGKATIEKLRRNTTDTRISSVLSLFHTYKVNSKIKSTYLDPMPEYIEYDGRVHTSFNIGKGFTGKKDVGTVTGRLSSSDPNMQNIPKGSRIRSIFIPTPGMAWASADYSQLELRVGAFLAQDPVMMKIFEEDKDIHTGVMAELGVGEYNELNKIFNDKDHPRYEALTKQRVAFKAINFGIFFGRGPDNLSSDLAAQGVYYSPEQVRNFIRAWFKRFYTLKNWIEARKEEAINTGQVVTPTGYIRHLPGANRDTPLGNRILRQAVNSPVQGLAGQITLAALHLLHQRFNNTIDRWNNGSVLPQSHIIMTVHDSIEVETLLDKIVIEKEFRDIMEVEVKKDLYNRFGFKFNVPLKADCDYQDRWR